MSEEIAIAYADAGADLVEPTVHSGVRCCRAIHAFARRVGAASQRVLAILDAVARLWGAPIRPSGCRLCRSAVESSAPYRFVA